MTVLCNTAIGYVCIYTRAYPSQITDPLRRKLGIHIEELKQLFSKET